MYDCFSLIVYKNYLINSNMFTNIGRSSLETPNVYIIVMMLRDNIRRNVGHEELGSMEFN